MPMIAASPPSRTRRGRRAHSLLALGAALLAGLPLPRAAHAQASDYPNKPVRFVVSSAAGGVVDIRARRFGQRLSELLRQPVIVDNKPGASTTIGAEFVARSAPDGYTALFGGNTETVWVNALEMAARYDPAKDLVPVAQFTLGYPVLVVHAGMGPKTLQELVEWARARPGQLSCGTAGHGSGQHFVCEMLARAANIRLQTVPYKGTGPMLQDTAAGQVHVSIGFLAEVDRQYITPGRVIALGVLGPRRLSARFPDLPTMAELGYPNFELLSWTGLFVPAGTPPAVISRLNTEIRKVVQEPEFATWLGQTGSDVVTPTTEQFRDFVRTEMVRWKARADEYGIKAEK
ncbi:MAG: tripartite tricarboxylate transporter substrate binding protein [Burkholderiales bacterium]|nr:tripartite tricarboxylate transporter substrate binding protein [Burkholderiales bacterium]